ncbi:MAG: hypothetical protein QOF14_5816 [Hyphomicrobiales bacterium]|jgi:hypothetical protein|nr:hypothetical protein [Hyphomicrobiales bacterium]
MKTLNVELPDYVWTAFAIRTAEPQTSIRHLIMNALQADGLAIAAADITDASLRNLGNNNQPARP